MCVYFLFYPGTASKDPEEKQEEVWQYYQDFLTWLLFVERTSLKMGAGGAFMIISLSTNFG